MGLVEVGGADGKAPGIDVIGYGECSRARGCLPGVLVEFGQTDRQIFANSVNLHDVPGKFPDHVTARYPCRQSEQLSFLIRVGDGDGYTEQMCVQIQGFDGIMNSLCHIVDLLFQIGLFREQVPAIARFVLRKHDVFSPYPLPDPFRSCRV